MKNSKKKQVLTVNLFEDESINKNDIVCAVAYVLQKHRITYLAEDFLEYLRKNYSEYLLEILLIVPISRKEVKEQLIRIILPVKPRDMLQILKAFKDDEDFCEFCINLQEYHKNAADHGLPA